MKTLGQRIRARRKELKLTQEDVAKKIGVSAVAIGHWEKDTNEPSGMNLHALAKVLRISIEELVDERFSIKEWSTTHKVNLSDEAFAVALAFEQSSPEMKAAALRLLEILEVSDKSQKGG